MTAPSTVMITGANRGIGLEFVKQYADAGYQVLACCRAGSDKTELEKVKQDFRDNIAIYSLDVTDEQSIASFKQEIGSMPIDILINNAGLSGNIKLADVNNENWQPIFQTNAIAPLLVTQALADNVAASSKRQIINISSAMGSIGENSSGGCYPYRASKAALNAFTKSLAIDLQDQQITVVVMHPGWVKTDMGGPNALITTTESVTGIMKIVENLSLEQSGRFIRFDGGEVAW